MLEELFGTWVGQLSLFVIVFVIVMGWYIYRMVLKKMAEDEARSLGK